MTKLYYVATKDIHGETGYLYTTTKPKLNQAIYRNWKKYYVIGYMEVLQK